jgi:E3 ubiquitin-protein ligase TRIP12
MIKTRARVERASTRQAAAASSSNTGRPIPPVSTFTQLAPASQEHPPAEATPADLQMQDGEETVNHSSAKEPSPDRTELLRSKPAVVGRFMRFMVPILIDVYAASVITPVRVKTLTGLLKAVSFLDGEGLKGVLTV